MKPFEIAPRTAEALGWPELLRQLSDRCHTERGRAASSELRFCDTAEEVTHELELVAEARALHDRSDPMPFGSVFDLRIPLRRLEKEGILEGPTLVQVANTLQGGARLRRFLLGRSSPNLGTIANRLKALDDVSGPIADSFDEHGVLADHASRDLGRLRKRRVELHERLSSRMRNLMDKPSIAKYLQDRFYTQREDRFVLPIRSDAGPAVQGIVHGSSASGATLFVEPREVVGLNNELKVAEMEVTREEARILAELSDLVGEEWQAIWDNLELLERLDVIDARARLAIKLDAHPARVIPCSAQLELWKMRHPLMVLSGMEVVANDLSVDPGNTVVISGPNAGGKTVSLKTLGLCALMQRAGMHLPTGPDCQMPLFDAVLTEMGDDQSIEHSLSTFTAHLTHLLRFLDAASPQTLILLDEIAVGTDPGEGAALAQSILEGFAGAGARVVVTTHYERLKTIAVEDDRFANASVGFDMRAMSPTYRLHLGLPGSSGAIAVARRVGLAEGLAARAEALLQGGGQEMARLLASVSDQRTQLAQEQEALQRATDEARRAAEQHRTELERIHAKQEKALTAELQQSLDELKGARQELTRVRALLKRPATKERLQQADRQISAAAGTILGHQPKPQTRGRPAAADELVPGARVTVSRLGGEGEVMEPPTRGRVTVRVGGLRTQVAVDDVLLVTAAGAARPPRHAPKGTSSTAVEAPPIQRTPIRSAANTLDLRGMRVHEALASIDKALDDALRSGEETLFVIHGHGTGALRSALRQEHLPDHPLVERYESGAPKEGGEGVTVVFLK